MARRPPPTGSSVLPQQTRQNEYFVPRDGIDREVITADICRYLGNDALVRPGNYENPENGQIIQGYFINAYRNLTSAMIQDLKADSARWDQERRQQSANRNNAGGGTIASNGVFMRSSNTPPVQYRNSDIHQSRQHLGPTESSYPGTAGNDPYDNGPGLRYPGTGASGYTGATGTYAQYAASQGGYPTQAYGGNTVQFSPPAGNVASYGTGHSVAAAGYGQTSPDPPYNMVGANLRAGTQGQADPYVNDPYGPRGDPRDQRVPVTSTMAPTRATYTTAGPSSSQVFAAGQNASYYPQSATSASAPYSPAVQPGDPFYGRASPAGTTSYSATPDQYESTPVHKRTGSSQNTQLPTSGSSRHRNERENVERHTDSRHGHRPHRQR
ncbi:hypothetical protein GGR51DRAFT_571670 [Nemania sp. FL0031]|nr:hypothetical protein GGR51DRAFT_571670 [Nemania sp. FL0031]